MRKQKLFGSTDAEGNHVELYQTLYIPYIRFIGNVSCYWMLCSRLKV